MKALRSFVANECNMAHPRMKTAAEAVSDKTRRASHLLSDVFWSKKNT
jgi:acyl carrier protein phosphodiesterase